MRALDSSVSLSKLVARTSQSGSLHNRTKPSAYRVNDETVNTNAAPSSAVVPKNFTPVCGADHCSRLVATYTMTEQKTPAAPAKAAPIRTSGAKPRKGETIDSRGTCGMTSGAATSAAYSKASLA